MRAAVMALLRHTTDAGNIANKAGRLEPRLSVVKRELPGKTLWRPGAFFNTVVAQPRLTTRHYGNCFSRIDCRGRDIFELSRSWRCRHAAARVLTCVSVHNAARLYSPPLDFASNAASVLMPLRSRSRFQHPGLPIPLLQSRARERRRGYCRRHSSRSLQPLVLFWRSEFWLRTA